MAVTLFNQMRIKRLSLQGYKTFATKTDFVFDEGITAIVGPNGSGKSNIADALRWVLGEQSYSSLRGKRTTDMIFSGSRSRARAGMAQAILTLDNSEGWLPIDYTEVEIGRRAFRSGENEYILNGQKVRLKDVTDLLANSGLSERTYTIIGQGLVDRALSLRAEERRALFEEAAGINHYKSRRAETMRRLQETQHNLQRVHDILAEIRPRLNSLRRQATRARNYEQVSADLRNLLRIWYGFKWELAKKEMRQAKETAVATENNWQASRHKLRVRQENAEDLRRRIRRLEQQLNENQSQRDELRDALEVARREVAIFKERQDAIQRQLLDIEAELPNLGQQVQTAQLDLSAAISDLEAAQQNLNEAQGQLLQFNQGFEQQQAQINHWQNSLTQAQSEQQATQNHIAQTQGQLNQLREQLKDKQNGRQTAVSQELVKAEQAVAAFTAVLQSKQSEQDKLRQKREALQQQRHDLINELKTLRREHREQEQSLHTKRNNSARLEAQVEMLGQLRLKEVNLSNGLTILGNLASFISIPTSYKTALEAALSNCLAALILNDTNVMWSLLEQQDGETAVAVIALDALPPFKPPPTPKDTAVIGWANELVESQPAAQAAIDHILGHILVVKDAKSAFKVARQCPAGVTAVALDGFLAHAGGLVEAGNRGQNSVLAREEEWRQSQTALAELKVGAAALETAVAQQQTLIQEKQNLVDQLQNEDEQLSLQHNEARQDLAQAQRDLDRQKQQQNFFQQQKEAQQQEINQLEKRIADFESQTVSARESLVKMEATIAQAQKELKTLPVAEAQQQRDNLQQTIQAAQTIVAGRQAVVDSRRATLNQFERQLNRQKERQTQLLAEQTSLSVSAKEQQRNQLQAQLKEIDDRLNPLRQRLQEARAELAQFEEDTAVAQKETHDAETHYTQAKITFTQRKTEIENLQDRIKSDLGIVALHYDEDQTGPTPLPIDGIKELPVVEELPEDLEESIQNYRGQMQRMGAINPDAPEEYEETEARFEFMTQQIEDLNQTEKQLREVIAELDDLTSKAFVETVEKVNAVFANTFTQLFGGGAGRLVLTDPDDLTISGVDIIARLPNRREQALGLLSGGERSLTAVALIFSLLKVSPTPFCVLDEVDAALDEANINRFRELLLELSLATQFIIITHNRGTVQAAQTLYGISMGTDSASQAISIKPEDYVKQPELV